MTDPGVDELDAWADRHPLAANSVKVAIGWALLMAAAFLTNLIPVVGAWVAAPLMFVAGTLAIGWCLILAYVNRDRLTPLRIALRAFWDRAWAFAVSVLRRDVRPYRFAGERANHQEQLRGTEIELNAMAELLAKQDASPLDQDALTVYEHGMEERLTVLLGKPRLTLEEKRERDAIETMLRTLRGRVVATPEMLGPQPMALFGPVGQAAGLLSGWKLWALAGAVTLSGWGMNFATAARLDHAKDDLAQARHDLVTARNNLAAAQEYGRRASAALQDAHRAQVVTSQTIEQERAATRAARNRERRRAREVQDILNGGPPPAWSLRESAADAGDPAGGPADDRQRVPAQSGGAGDGGRADPAGPA